MAGSTLSSRRYHYCPRSTYANRHLPTSSFIACAAHDMWCPRETASTYYLNPLIFRKISMARFRLYSMRETHALLHPQAVVVIRALIMNFALQYNQTPKPRVWPMSRAPNAISTLRVLVPAPVAKSCPSSRNFAPSVLCLSPCPATPLSTRTSARAGVAHLPRRLTPMQPTRPPLGSTLVPSSLQRRNARTYPMSVNQHQSEDQPEDLWPQRCKAQITVP